MAGLLRFRQGLRWAVEYRLRPLLIRAALPFVRMPLDKPRVHHGGGRSVWGGVQVKLRRMQAAYPDTPFGFNLIYSVSGTVPAPVVAAANKRGAKVVCHLNSMFHPAYRPDYKELNRPIADIHARADHIVYGSRHAQEGARRYLGSSDAPHSFIFNAVDLELFKPAPWPEGPPTILALGVQRLKHALVPLIRAFPMIRKTHPDARLIIAGPLAPGQGIWDCGPKTIQDEVARAGGDGISLVGRYAQEQAPGLINSAHVVVHLKHMDWTPNVVVEAMACGRAVVHAGNGGLPELVGECGVGLDLPTDWDRLHQAGPEAVAAGVLRALEGHQALGGAARVRAEKEFSLTRWLEKHRVIFEGLLKEMRGA